jgi:hypothetical protein
MDIDKATTFMTTHARVLDRRRFALLLGEGDRADVLTALEAYRNPDGGYGWGMEPDLRSPTSQPVAAMHALEVLGEIGAEVPEELLVWLDKHTLPDGGLPMALPMDDPAGSAPFWASAAPDSTLMMTSQVAATALRAGVAPSHPWLATAIDYTLQAIRAITDPHAYELLFSVHFLSALGDRDELARLRPFVPADGLVPVAGGLPDEVKRPLDFAPMPDTPARVLFDPDVIAADLARLDSEQRDDGGWTVNFTNYSPAAELDWRGYVTVGAVTILRANGHPS